MPLELAELAIRFNAMPTAADRRRAAAAVCSVLEAIDGRASEAAPKFKAHPMDCLIVAVVEERGVVPNADIFAEVEGETYMRRGEEIPVAFSTFNRRLKALSDYGAIQKTGGGYAVGDAEKVAHIDSIDFGA